MWNTTFCFNTFTLAHTDSPSCLVVKPRNAALSNLDVKDHFFLSCQIHRMPEDTARFGSTGLHILNVGINCRCQYCSLRRMRAGTVKVKTSTGRTILFMDAQFNLCCIQRCVFFKDAAPDLKQLDLHWSRAGIFDYLSCRSRSKSSALHYSYSHGCSAFIFLDCSLTGSQQSIRKWWYISTLKPVD